MTLEDIFAAAPTAIAARHASDVELKQVAASANEFIQRLQDLVGREHRDAARIRFPRGYLREAGLWRFALPFVYAAPSYATG